MTDETIFEEQTLHNRDVEEISSTTLDQELPDELKNYSNNLIKLDVQGSEINILLENVLQKTLEFNEKYLDFLENKLKEMKTKRTELLDGRSTSSI